MLYGRDILTWLLETEPPVAWRTNAGGGITLQLYRLAWENPLPDVPIESLELVSMMTHAAPFAVGLTAE